MTSPYAPGSKRPLDSAADGSGPKRQRSTESRVVFVSGLPSDCLESELLALCCPFAVVEKSLLVPEKAQAFVQLPDVASATNLLQFYQTRDATIRGHKITFEYSTREDLSTFPSSAGESAPVNHGNGAPSPAAYAMPPTMQSAPPSSSYDPYAPGPVKPSSSAPPAATGFPPAAAPTVLAGELVQYRRGGVGIANVILMVTVTNIEYDVTVDVLHQVFQKFGNVRKIVTFWKKQRVQGARRDGVGRPGAVRAERARRPRHLHGLQHAAQLRVRFNNERSRDFANPHLPPGPGAGAADNNAPGAVDGGYDLEPPVDPYGPPPTQHGPPHAHGLPPQDPYGPPPSQQHHQLPPEYGRDEPPRRSDGRGGGGGGRFDYPLEARAHALPPHSTGRSLRLDIKKSPVLICSNMDSRLVNPDKIFTFFGCFGDVLRVKIMFRKQDTALIQFADEAHATSALDHLDGVHVFGKKLRVDFSKHTSVSMPRGEVDRFELENTRDFSSSPLHRYRRRSPTEASPPSPLLHVTGIPSDLQRHQNALVDLFAQYGYVKNFQVIPKNPKAALVEMASLDEAIMALIHLDNYRYPEVQMRVSFSKSFQLNGPGGAAALPPPSVVGPGPGPGPAPGPYGPGPGAPMLDRYAPPPSARDRSRDRSRDPVTEAGSATATTVSDADETVEEAVAGDIK
ncbi:hypothetical protein PINS_up018098 [Pythium insidiosum]|nr:hypothetical protein PINS_up018098 [Pythium insidiosum]